MFFQSGTYGPEYPAKPEPDRIEFGAEGEEVYAGVIPTTSTTTPRPRAVRKDDNQGVPGVYKTVRYATFFT